MMTDKYMRTEIEQKLHLELKNNLKKVLEFYKDTVSWNDATRIFDKATEELNFEVKEAIIPKIQSQTIDTRKIVNHIIFGDDKRFYDKEEPNNPQQ